MPLRVLLADDHHVVRQALKALLEHHGFRVVAEASDGGPAVELAGAREPDVAVLDVAMPVLNGVDAARDIARCSPHTRVILLTALPDAQFASAVLQAGVRGFVPKAEGIDDLVHAIAEVSDGAMYVSPGASPSVLDALQAAHVDGAQPLSRRERQVVQLVAEGKSTNKSQNS